MRSRVAEMHEKGFVPVIARVLLQELDRTCAQRIGKIVAVLGLQALYSLEIVAWAENSFHLRPCR